MREIRPSGLAGGGTEFTRSSLPRSIDDIYAWRSIPTKMRIAIVIAK